MANRWDGVRSALSSKRTAAVVAVTGVGAAVGISAFMVLPGATATPAGKVTICHRTASESNPYVTNTVSVDSVDETNNEYLNGHGDHTGPVFDPVDPQAFWGDIIPPFTNEATGSSFPGYNWTADGQAWWSNGCADPSESSSASTSNSESTSESSSESSSSSSETSTITTPASETSATGSESSSSASTSQSESTATSAQPGSSSGSTTGSSETSATGAVTTGTNPGGGSTNPPTGIGAGGGATASTSKPMWLWPIAALLALLGLAAGARVLAPQGKHQ